MSDSPPAASGLIAKVRALVAAGEVRISEHGYDQLAEDHLMAREVISGVGAAVVVEEYLEFPKGPAILLLQRDRAGQPIHAVWGIPKGHNGPVVLVTAYRPDPERWDEGFTRRRR